MSEFLDAFTKLMQALSLPLGVLVAVMTLKTKGEDKAGNQAGILVGMQKDIEHIKENTQCIPAQGVAIAAIDSSCKAAHKRMDDHMRYEHGIKKEENP